MAESGNSEFLVQAATYLGAAAVAVPIFNRFRLGAILGYLTAGVLIGPYALNLLHQEEGVFHVAEFGVVLFLFVIGLELSLTRLWAMRRAIDRSAQSGSIIRIARASAYLAGRAARRRREMTENKPKEIALEARGAEGARMFSPSVARNREIIADTFAATMPHEGAVLEVGSGTGEHAVTIAARLPNVAWRPGDRSPPPAAWSALLRRSRARSGAPASKVM